MSDVDRSKVRAWLDTQPRDALTLEVAVELARKSAAGDFEPERIDNEFRVGWDQVRGRPPTVRFQVADRNFDISPERVMMFAAHLHVAAVRCGAAAGAFYGLVDAIQVR